MFQRADTGEDGGHGVVDCVHEDVRCATPRSPLRPWEGRPADLAAGGIADGRGVAAALALGAADALIGTRFQATAESLADPATAEAIVSGRGQDTERSGVLDIARGAGRPAAKYTARTLDHP